MPPSPATYHCGHERRPGTTVCLQCRQQAISWSARRQRRILAAGALTLGVVGILAVGFMMRRDAVTPRSTDETVVPTRGEVRAPEGGLSAAELQRAAATPASAAPAPQIAEGRTELGEGMYAVRTGDTVVVSFDTPDARTRRRDKFERTLRSTLRRVYGAPVDAYLAAHPENLLGARDLLGDVTATGLRLPLPQGGTIAVMPRTRPGLEGPLVVSYMATPAP